MMRDERDDELEEGGFTGDAGLEEDDEEETASDDDLKDEDSYEPLDLL